MTIAAPNNTSMRKYPRRNNVLVGEEAADNFHNQITKTPAAKYNAAGSNFMSFEGILL
jgi:hypothetical protein